MTSPGQTNGQAALGKGIVADYRGRRPWYLDDWREGVNSGFRFSVASVLLLTLDVVVYLRIFAPATYIFFASAIPALAFGEQIDHATGAVMWP